MVNLQVKPCLKHEDILTPEELVGLVLGNCVMEADWLPSPAHTAKLRKRLIQDTEKDMLKMGMLEDMDTTYEPTTLTGRVCKTLELLAMYRMDDDIHNPTELDKAWSLVYRLCHIASEKCGNPHETWVEEFEKLEAEVNETNKSPAEKHYDSIRELTDEEKTRLREQL